MANNRKASGQRIKIVSASANITSGKPVVQEGFFGIALDTIASGASGWMAIEGIWKVGVPASTVKGDILYVPGAAGTLTEDADVTADFTRTPSNTVSPVCVATTDRDTAGNAEVLIMPRAASRSATQV